MRLEELWDDEQLDPELLAEMANLPSEDTGLPMNIYISDNSGIKHGPRIKVQTNHSPKFRKDLLVSVTIDQNPRAIGTGLSAKDMTIITEFVRKNRTLLMQYWNKQTGIGNVMRSLIKYQASQKI